MTFWAGSLRSVFLLAVLVVGCTPSGSGPLDEEKEPHFLAGKEKASTFDWKGAIQCYEKALQVNPGSASAHFELGWIFDQKEPDPAAAIYHYDHFLRLKPTADNAAVVKDRIGTCKQALAQTVYLGPITEKVQRQLEQSLEEGKRLTEENKQLREDLAKWSSYAARLQTLTNQSPPQATAPVRTSQTTSLVEGAAPSQVRASAPAASSNSSTSASAARTHSVKSGDTPSLIARKYGIKLDALMAANPSLDARRLRIGQVLRIPGT